MLPMNTLLCFAIAISLVFEKVQSHGYLMDPPSRSSMWRFGFQTPRNYDDNQLFCGGFDRQWNQNGGRCGVCGDPWDGVRENEAGGKYALGIISKHYNEGQIIQVKVKITASHKGYFEFRLCPHNNPRVPVTQECLNRYLLHQPSGSTQYMEQGRPQVYTVTLKLPQGVTCTQCVLQWKYNAGNSYGVDAYGRTCLGCGKQEQFYGCADISISSASGSGFASSSSSGSSYGSVNNGAISPYGSGGYNGFPIYNHSPVCTATAQFRAIYPSADQYCKTECSRGHCPQGYCNDSCHALYQG